MLLSLMLSKILSNSHSFELHTERRTGLRYERHINQRAGKSYFSLFFLVIPLPQAQQEVCKYVFIFWHFAIPCNNFKTNTEVLNESHTKLDELLIFLIPISKATVNILTRLKT